jgi:hypothetical protein
MQISGGMHARIRCPKGSTVNIVLNEVRLAIQMDYKVLDILEVYEYEVIKIRARLKALLM